MSDLNKAHNDALMETGYQILEECKENEITCLLWGGGAINHIVGGRLDYRKMSDLEFFLPKKADKPLHKILTELGFIANRPFNTMQNMSRTPRREFYKPNRELSSTEIEHVEHGRKSNVKDVKFHKVELFIDGIRMCWTFNFKELPVSYNEALICPPGFQLALKANAIHPDDFDLKDIQDISSIMNANGRIAETDSIFKEPQHDPNIEFSIGTEVFKRFSNLKLKFPSTIIRNFNEVLNYNGAVCCNENGKEKLAQIVEFLEPLKGTSGFITKMRKERPERVDARHI
jgi:hypothetical protein